MSSDDELPRLAGEVRERVQRLRSAAAALPWQSTAARAFDLGLSEVLRSAQALADQLDHAAATLSAHRRRAEALVSGGLSVAHRTAELTGRLLR